MNAGVNRNPCTTNRNEPCVFVPNDRKFLADVERTPRLDRERRGASRDSPIRAAAIGLAVPRLQWAAFVVAGTIAGLAGSLFAFAKGTISPETLGVAKSVDGLVMVLLGGVQAVSGPWVGGALFTWLQDTVARQTDYWRALLGITMLALVLVFPLGVAGGLKRFFIREAVPS